MRTKTRLTLLIFVVGLAYVMSFFSEFSALIIVVRQPSLIESGIVPAIIGVMFFFLAREFEIEFDEELIRYKGGMR